MRGASARVLLTCVFGLMIGCGGGNSINGTGGSGNSGIDGTGGSTTTYTAKSGVAEKGPLIQGSQITVQELDKSLNPTGKQYTFQITSDLGIFSPNASFTSKLLSAAATGYYYDETQNAVSGGPITLESYCDLSSDSAMNINLLTSLAYEREQNLVESGNTLDQARKTAEKEVLAAFHIRNAEQFTNFGQLDISQSGIADHILVAISSAFEYGQSSGNLSSLIASFQSDLADNGIIDSSSTLSTIASSSEGLNPATIASNMNAKYQSNALDLTATDITDWLDRDGDGVIGKYKFYQLSAVAGNAYASPVYTAGPDDDGTTMTVSAGTLLDNGTPVSSSGAVVHEGDSLTIQLTASSSPNVPITAYLLSNGSRIARFTVTTAGISLSVGSALGNNGVPFSVLVTPDNNTLLLTSFDPCWASSSGCSGSASSGGLYTYNLADPSTPALLGHTYQIYSPYEWAGYYQVAYSSETKTAFIADSHGYLQSFDVSNPASPSFTSSVDVGCQVMSEAVSTDQQSIFFTDACSNLSQFNIAAPGNMTLLSKIPIKGQPWSMALSPDGQQLLLFVQGDIQVVNLSSGLIGTVTDLPANSALISFPNGIRGFASGTYISNRTAVLIGPTGATTVDFTNPQSPAMKGAVSLTPIPEPAPLIGYAAFYSSTKGLVYLVAYNNFYVMNVSDPANPYIEGGATLPSTQYDENGPSVGTSVSATSDGKMVYVATEGQASAISIP